MRSGVIRLFDERSNSIAVSLQYFTREHRYKIIAMWRRLYGRGFNRCHLQIMPTVKENSYNRLTGINMRWRKDVIKYPRGSEIIRKKKSKILAYSENGFFLGEFNGSRDVSAALPISHPSVLASIKDNGRIINGMYFKRK